MIILVTYCMNSQWRSQKLEGFFPLKISRANSFAVNSEPTRVLTFVRCMRGDDENILLVDLHFLFSIDVFYTWKDRDYLFYFADIAHDCIIVTIIMRSRLDYYLFAPFIISIKNLLRFGTFPLELIYLDRIKVRKVLTLMLRKFYH